MADSKIEEIAEAIASRLNATGEFKVGAAHAMQTFGAHPSFCVWWDGMDEVEREERLSSGPEQTEFHFAIDIQSLHVPSLEGQSQRDHWRLVRLVRRALKDDKTLGGLVLKSRITKTECDFGVAKPSKPLWRTVMGFDVTYFGRW